MPKAELLLRTRQTYGRGFVEMVVWRTPRPVPPTGHGFKYRLAYVVGGARLVGYDNERGKGDHRHVGGREVAYRFMNIDRLMADFLQDVEDAR